jgi:sec-independent protein translocase protein TatA
LFLNGLGGGELLLIGLAILLFFGGKKLPELMRGLGKGIREFQDAKNEVKDQINKELDETKK